MNNRYNSGIWLYIFVCLFIWWVVDDGFGSCDEYASKYSCDYVIEKADYEVYYWRDVNAGNPDAGIPIGRVVGLKECKNTAMNYAAIIRETWNERGYLCYLVDDGKYMEKHRLLK